MARLEFAISASTKAHGVVAFLPRHVAASDTKERDLRGKIKAEQERQASLALEISVKQAEAKKQEVAIEALQREMHAASQPLVHNVRTV